jgi:catechol 2,3-dioxygenase-like lactoylglutathione lyase family enzyme
MAFLGFDHVDLRVPSLAAVEAFYGTLLPRLGLTRKSYAYVDARGEWDDGTPERYNALEWYEEGAASRPFFVGVIEDEDMIVGRTRFAFRIASRADFDAWVELLRELRAREIEIEDREASSSLFFADPLGTRLELLATTRR